MATTIIIAVLVFLVIILGYVKAPTDKAYIITGLRKTPKIIIGKSAIRIPFLQRVDKLSLKALSVDVKTSKSVPTNDYINIFVDSVANVKVGATPELLEKASHNFLNKDEDYIRSMIVNVLEGNIREIIGSMKLTDIVTDRKKFASLVQENASIDMANMGLEIVAFNIQNIDDDGLGAIENLGVANTVAIRKDAEISKAEAERDMAVAQAKAAKESNDAEIDSQTSIAEKQNDLAIKKAELKQIADAKQAEADAAYEIQKQEQQKTIQIAAQEVNIAKQDKEAELQDKNISVQEKTLDATVKKQADAEKYKRIAEAEASLVEKQKAAEAIKLAGEAEAAAIKAKGEAEAAAMEKKADAMTKYGKAAMLQMIVEQLPEMAKAIAEPMSKIDKIDIIDSGSGEGSATSVGGYVPAVLAKTIKAVKETTGVDITDIMKAETYDAKVNKNINVSGIPGVPNVTDHSETVTVPVSDTPTTAKPTK